MKKFSLFIFIAWVTLSLTSITYHKVKVVYDGDTVLLENGEKVRYLGIDAPEVNHNGGESEFLALAASELNRKMVHDKTVRLERSREATDHYGRILAYVFLKDGKMVNDILIQKGMAHIMAKTKDLRYWEMLLESQRKAMEEKIGIWSENPKNKEKFYLGNVHSLRFHRPGCSLGKNMFKKNQRSFKKRNDAFWEGYSPCRQCNP